MDWKFSILMAMVWTFPKAMAVALRGLLSRIAISPKISPGFKMAMVFS